MVWKFARTMINNFSLKTLKLKAKESKNKMSRSKPDIQLQSPAKLYFEWDAVNGSVKYYDKAAEQNVNIPLPFRFLILDRVSLAGGGIDRNGSYESFWSNAIKNLDTQELTVRSKSGIVAKGLWANIKQTPGVKFQTGLYIAYKDDEGYQIGFLKFRGAALNGWIEITQQFRNIYQGSFAIQSAEERKKGATVYQAPIFAHYDAVSPEAEAAALALDKELQVYLDAYFNTKAIAQAEEDHVPTHTGTQEQEIDEIPF